MAKKKTEVEKVEETSLDEVYTDRNQLALLCSELARQLNYATGFRIDPDEPDWPVLFIELPTGQISYHLPKAFVLEAKKTLKVHINAWDGHTSEEKRLRVMQYLTRQFAHVR